MPSASFVGAWWWVKRLVFVLLFVCAVATGWLLRGYIDQAGASSSQKRQVVQKNVALTRKNTPLSSNFAFAMQRDVSLLRLSPQDLALTSGLHPGRGQPIPPAEDVLALPVLDVEFYNWRGELLSGWLSTTTPGAPTIILTHGTPGNRLSMVSRAAFLHAHGYNVLLFDFQSYGRSQGEFSTLGMVESEDIAAAITFLHGIPETADGKIGVLGLSMGATAAVLAAARTSDVAAVVAESCPVDATRVEADVPNEEALDADRRLVKAIYGVDITQARPIDVVGKLSQRTAVFFINGDVDTITPLSGTQSLYQAAGEPKQYLVVPKAGHAQAFEVAPALYEQQVDAFFDASLA